MVELLMENGGNPNIIPNDGVEMTTMLLAAVHGNLSMLKVLLNVDNKYKNSFDWVCVCSSTTFKRACTYIFLHFLLR